VLSLFSVTIGNILSVQAKTPGTPKVAQNSSSSNSFDDYRKECLQRSRKQGLTQVDADKLCNCTINKFRSRYNIQQFRALVQKSKTDKAAQRTLNDVGEACFDEILYEE
jgi:hypothetical protein